jgi:hypothetical protein
MSAKKVSKMCIFVHKSVKNARFSPRKVQKRGFFAGGRGDFLAGQKRGFLGSAGSRRRAHASPFFVSHSRREKALRASTTQKSNWSTYASFRQKNYFMKINRRMGMLRMHRALRLVDWVCNLQSELADRPEAIILLIFIILILLFLFCFCPAQRGCEAHNHTCHPIR